MAWKDVKSERVITGQEFKMSDTKLRTYLRCPLQFKFIYVDGKRIPPDSARVVGISAHAGIEHNYREKFKTRKPAPLSEVLDVTAQNFEQNRREVDFGGEKPGVVKDRAVGFTKLHYDAIAPTVQPLKEPELKFEVKVDGAKRPFIGRIDLIGSIKSAARRIKSAIIDNKTTRYKFQQFNVDVDTQLTSYAYVHKKMSGSLPDAEVIDAVVQTKQGVGPQRVVTSRTMEQLKRWEERYLVVERLIAQGVFYPTDNAMTCGWCGFNQTCHYSAVKRRDVLRGKK